MGLGPGQERPAKKSGSWPGRVIDGPGACRGDHRTGQGLLCCQLVAGEIQAVKQRSRRDPLSQPHKQAGPIACKREGELHSLSSSGERWKLESCPQSPSSLQHLSPNPTNSILPPLCNNSQLSIFASQHQFTNQSQKQQPASSCLPKTTPAPRCRTPPRLAARPRPRARASRWPPTTSRTPRWLSTTTMRMMTRRRSLTR